MGVSLLLAVVAVGFLLARRNSQALNLFSAAVLALATAAALFTPVLLSGLDSLWVLGYAFAAGLLLAGMGQCIAALRNPNRYPAALVCSVASGAFVVGPVTIFGLNTWLRGILIAVPCLLLGAASLTIALRHHVKPGLRFQKHILSILVLINLTVFFLALAYGQTGERIIYVDDVNVIIIKEQVADLIANTHWRWVLAAITGSVLSSATYSVLWSRRRSPEVVVRRR